MQEVPVTPPAATSAVLAPLAPPDAPASIRTAALAVLVQPEFPGGDAALIQFLSQTLRYPADAWAQGVAGRVDVSFWIDAQGHPYGFGVLQNVHPSLDAEALRALKLMPTWVPGQRNGQPAPMMVHVPVAFRRPGSGQ